MTTLPMIPKSCNLCFQSSQIKLKSLLTNCHKKTAALGNSLIKARKTIVVWNHSVAMRLLYASFEICELYAFLTLVISANLMYLIINQ